MTPLASTGLAASSLWWAGPLVLMAVVFGPPILAAWLMHRNRD
jgi:hypothetical protein